MNKYVLTLAATFFVSASFPVTAALNVLACEPEWAAMARELGGDRVRVTSATTAQQDPHRIEARPSLIARARNADLLVCTGAELEIGWLPMLLRESANPRIQPGQAGHFMAAEFVPLLDRPQRLDRAEGDIHPQGNPHVQTDPRNIARVAVALARRLGQLDPAGAAVYAARHHDFEGRWQAALRRWEMQAAPLRGVTVASRHKTFTYLYQWLQLREVAVIEPKPGLEPSAAHLSRVLGTLQCDPVRIIVQTTRDAPRAAGWLAERAGVPVVALPDTVGGSDRATDLFGLFDDILARLRAALR